MEESRRWREMMWDKRTGVVQFISSWMKAGTTKIP